MEPDDPRLVDFIGTWFLQPPPNDGGKHFMEISHTFNMKGQIDQPLIVDRRLKGMQNGFYIEAGASDGVGFSNTIFFEAHRNWTGLLIEADIESFASLSTKRRNVSGNCCKIQK